MGPLLLKFIAGGVSVSFITWLARRWGGHVGGYLAGFPAVFLTAIAVTAWGRPARSAHQLLTGMVTASVLTLIADVIMAGVAPRILGRWRWEVGLGALITLWAVLSVGFFWLGGQ